MTKRTMSQPMQTMVSQLTDECYTPAPMMELWREVLGPIELDPASCEVANRTVQAARYYTKRDGGLTLPWRAKTVFLNPPFNNGVVNRWVRRLRAAYADAHITEAAGLLVNSAPGYGWWHELVTTMPCVVLDERLTFLKEDGTPYPDHHKKGQTVAYLGPDVRRFFAVFGARGLPLLPGPYLVELIDRLDTLRDHASAALRHLPKDKIGDGAYQVLSRAASLADLASGSAGKLAARLDPAPEPCSEVRDAAA